MPLPAIVRTRLHIEVALRTARELYDDPAARWEFLDGWLTSHVERLKRAEAEASE